MNQSRKDERSYLWLLSSLQTHSLGDRPWTSCCDDPDDKQEEQRYFWSLFSPKNISCELWRLSCVVWFSTLEIVCKWLVFVCVRVWGFLWLVASELRSALLDIGKLHMNFWHFMRGCPTLCEVKDACDDRWWHRWGLIVFQADNVQGWSSGTDCLRL